MKIGIYTPYLDTLTGGELYMLTIAEYLSRKHNVDLLWDDESILEKAQKRFNLDLEKVKIVENIFKEEVNSKGKFLKTLKYDRIIYLSDGSIPFLFPKKLIVHFQAPFIKEDIPSFEKKKAILINKVICNSKFTKSYIDDAFGIKSNVLYPPVQGIEVDNTEKSDTILTVGRYQPYENGSDFKKLSFMIDVFKKLNNKSLKMKIYVSLKPEYNNAFLENIEEKIDSRIEIIKNSSLKEIQDAYKTSKIYWHAAGYGEDIENHPERAEHFGITTVEAMTAGCIPIVINLGGQKEIIENGVNGYLWNDEKELIEITAKIVKEDSLRRKMSKNAMQISEKFSKSKFCKQLELII